MALNKDKFTNTVVKLVKDGAKAAYKKVYATDTSDIDNDLAKKDTITKQDANNLTDKLANKMSEVFADEFSKTVGSDLANEIDSYIRSITINHVLTAPNGPVQGTIKIS